MSEFEGRGKSLDAGYANARRSEPAPRERKANEKAADATTLARNLDGFEQRVHDGITAMAAAAQANDRVAWDAAKRDADAGLKDIRSYVALALAAANDATDAPVRERLATIKEVLKEAENATTTASAQPPTPRAPALSIADDLLAALPPDHPVFPAEQFYKTAKLAVEWVFRERASSSDIAAFKELMARHRDHEIARRFRRFEPPKQEALLAVLEKNEVKLAARDREQQRRREAAAAVQQSPVGATSSDAERLTVEGAALASEPVAPLDSERSAPREASEQLADDDVALVQRKARDVDDVEDAGGGELAARAGGSELAETAARDAAPIARGLGLDTFDPERQIVIDETGAPAGRAGARGAAHGDAIHLDSRSVAADTREVVAHELVHLAQAELPASQDQGRAAAESEAAEIATEIAGGAAPRPPTAAISLTAAAADSDAPRAPRGDTVPGGLGPRWAAAAGARYLGDGRFELNRSKRHIEVRRTDRAPRVELRGEGYVIELPRRLVGVELEQRFVTECARLDAQTGAPTAQLDEEALARRRQLIGALSLVTPRWKELGGALFTAADEPAAPHPPEAFTAQAFELLLEMTTDVAPVELVLAGPGRERYARAFAEATKVAERDRPRLSQIRTDIAYLVTGGELEFAATRLVSTHALLSALGKDALRSRGELAKDPIFTYAHTDAVAHGVKIKCSRLVAEGVDFVSAATLAAPGGPERSRAVIALGNLLIAGTAAPAPAALPVPSADPATVTAEAAALTKLVQDAIAQASANHKLAPDVFQRLDTALGAASPRARELVWANHDVTAALARALDPSQSKALLGKLDPVEALYQTVKPSEWQTAIKLKFAPPQRPPPKLSADNPAYPALRAWLEAHPGEPNRALRARLLEHVPLKRDVIDRLPADQQPIIYRLITSGSAAPTAEDQVHEAAERGRGADVVRALRALASTAPARLTELERDAVFRRAIEGLRDVVDVDGVPLRPYDVCLTLWGRNPREAAELQSGAPREVNTTGDERPLTADERLRLDSELFDPALADIRAQVANTAPRPPGLYHALNAVPPLRRAQAILDRLRLFERQAAQPAYKGLLQRERLMAGAELGKRFGRRWNIDLRTWVYESGGPNIRSGVARILGTELGAAVGAFNGEHVGAGDALPEKMTLQQALRETTAGAEGWTISEWCSVESRALSRAIDDQDKAAVLASWTRFAGAIEAAAPELARLTGRTLRPIDLLRNAMMEHGGHLETRIAERFAAAERDELSDRLGITTAAREDAAHAPPPDVAQQAEAAYGASAKQLWSCWAALNPRSALSEYTALGRLWALVRNLPRLDATPADPHAIEERPPRSFAAYYRAHYGASIDGHAEAVLRAMPDRERAVPLADACRELGIDPQRMGAVLQQPAAETLAIDAHNQHLVRAEFTVDDAKGRARQIWQVLHGSGRLETIHTQLYGDCNDEEQRLIRVAFRQLSGGFDLAFYLRQAIDAQQRRASEHADDSPLAQAAAAVTNQDQQSTIGATGSLAGAQVIAAGGGGGTIHVHGTETELARGLAVAKDGQIDIKTSLDAAARREDTDQVFRTLDEATPADKRAILNDGPLVTRLRSLGQWQWERCFKVLSNQADLADRLYSRSHGDGGFLESAFGGTHEAGIKEDLKGNGRRLRLKFDAEVRAEIARLPEPPAPQAIDREIHRRVLDAAGFDAADPSVDAILRSELSGDELGEMQAMVRNAGTARDWAVACGGGATAIRAEIRALSPAERAAKLRDPRYLQLLGERLTDPEEHRAALNALGATDDADIAHEGGALARLDAAVRTADARRTLRALSELAPDEHARVRSNAQLTTQIMAALSAREQQVARELLGFEVVAAAAGAPTTMDPSGAAADASDPAASADASGSGAIRQRAALFVHQSAGRLRVACLGSWRDVLVQAAEIYKLDFALGFTQHGEGGHAQAAEATRPALDTAALRAQIWKRVGELVRAFAAEHQADPGKKTRDAITATQMIEIVQAAVLAQRDPSDALVAEHIFTADEKRGAAPDAMARAVLQHTELDASTDATGLAATLRAASDQHVIEHWTSIKHPPVGHDGDTLQHRYRELVSTEAAAAAQRKAPQTATPPAASTSDVEPAASPAAAASASSGAYATGPRVDDPVERTAVQAQRRFLEYQIKIAQALEEMLLPYMGDDRTATQTRAAGEQQLSGRDNKRYNDLAQIIYQRIPQLPAERIGQAIGIRPEHQWLLASEARRHAGEMQLRDQRYLRHHGEQNSAGSVAQDEKELVHEEQARLGRHHAQAIVDGQVTRAEGAEYDRRYEAVDRAQEAHQAAKEAAAAWASLIIGVVVTLAATVLTGGLATGPVAMMALAGATAALSATAKSLVMEQVLEGEWDREDAARMISTEVITGIVTMGTTYYAQRLLAAAGAATSLAKQGAAVRQILRRPPRLFQSIAHEAAEEVISEGMSGVVEAGLAATDPAHWMHGYEEGARSAKEAALARLAQVDNQALQGGVTAVLTSVGARVLHRTRRGGGHVDAAPVRDRALEVPAKQKKRVDVARNLKQTLGDPGEKFMEALIQWGMQQDGAINWAAAPSELLRGWIEEMGEGAVEVHTGTVHRAKRDAFTKAEIAKAKDRLPAHELVDYQQMQDGALDTDVLVSIADYQRIREYVILRGLATSEARGGFTLTPIQRRAFIEWVRVNTPQSDQLAITAATDPRTIPEVGNAASPAPGARARPAAQAPGGQPDAASTRPTEKMPAVDPGASSRPTVQIPAIDPNAPPQRPTVQTPAVDANEPSQRPTVQMPAVDANEPSQRPTVQMPAVGDSSRVVTGPRQIYADIPALENLSEAPSHAMFGAHQQSRVEPALQRLSDADYAAFRALIAAESHPVAQAFIFKALASNNTLDDIRWLAGEITGKDATWMADNLTLGDPREVGGGVKQQWSMSCNASTTITLRGNYDPIFALRLRHRNTDVGNVDDDDPNAMNMNQADLEKSMLESGYRGRGLAPQEHQGRATPRSQHGVGRPADDLFNDQSTVTGLRFTTTWVSPPAVALPLLDNALSQGMQVPVVIGDALNPTAHYVLAMARRESVSGEFEYQFHDTWTGLTRWVTAQQIASGQMPLSWGAITAIEAPAAASGPPPMTMAPPQGGAQHGGPSGPGSGRQYPQRPTLIADHTKPVVEWAEASLPDVEVPALLGSLEPKTTLELSKDISAATAQQLTAIYTPPLVNKVVPPWTGKDLEIEVELVGTQTAVQIVGSKADKPDKTLPHAKGLESHRAGEIDNASALKRGSLMVDANFIISIHKLMSGVPWYNKDRSKPQLQDGHRAMVNHLRDMAGLPPFPTDAEVAIKADVKWLIGDLDLRAANVVIGESAPRPAELTNGAAKPGELKTGLVVGDREGPEYNAVLAQLKALNVGGADGAEDQAMVADALFARRADPSHEAILSTFDAGVYGPLGEAFATYTPQVRHGTKGAYENHPEAIARTFHGTGFLIKINDGLGNSYELRIFPVSARYKTPNSPLPK